MEEREKLLSAIAAELRLPSSGPGTWNCEYLIHDVNNGRGDEWIPAFEELKLEKNLLDPYRRMVCGQTGDE